MLEFQRPASRSFQKAIHRRHEAQEVEVKWRSVMANSIPREQHWERSEVSERSTLSVFWTVCKKTRAWRTRSHLTAFCILRTWHPPFCSSSACVSPHSYFTLMKEKIPPSPFHAPSCPNGIISAVPTSPRHHSVPSIQLYFQLLLSGLRDVEVQKGEKDIDRQEIGITPTDNSTLNIALIPYIALHSRSL